jgi:hypothetical protein
MIVSRDRDEGGWRKSRECHCTSHLRKRKRGELGDYAAYCIYTQIFKEDFKM